MDENIKESDGIEKEERAKLTNEEFWKWKAIIEELLHAKSKILLEQRFYEIMGLKIQIEKLKQEMYREKIQLAKSNYANIEKEYKSYKEELETKLNRSLNNCVINEISYEVRDMDEFKGE